MHLIAALFLIAQPLHAVIDDLNARNIELEGNGDSFSSVDVPSRRNQTGFESDNNKFRKMRFKDKLTVIDQVTHLVAQEGKMTTARKGRLKMDSYQHILHRRATCQDGEVPCLHDGIDECLSQWAVCNRRVDCDDSSDEKNCEEKICPEQKCSTGRCIPFRWICDKYNHCIDNWDEHDCQNGTRVCPEEQCPTKCPEYNKNCPNTGQCILYSSVCNTIPDCFGGWDERYCRDYVCPEDYVKCPTTGQCVRSKWICDGKMDCPRGWDEENCTDGTRVDGVCPEAKCPDGVCIPFKSVCNTINDCIGGWDEQYCVESLCHSTKYRCDSGQCVSSSDCTGKGCMGKDVKCNGERECTDGSDETNCPDPTCISSTTIKCETGKSCFDEKAKCNGTEECLDGSDESNCSKKPLGSNSGLTTGPSWTHVMCITLWLRLLLEYL